MAEGNCKGRGSVTYSSFLELKEALVGWKQKLHSLRSQIRHSFLKQLIEQPELWILYHFYIL